MLRNERYFLTVCVQNSRIKVVSLKNVISNDSQIDYLRAFTITFTRFIIAIKTVLLHFNIVFFN